MRHPGKLCLLLTTALLCLSNPAMSLPSDKDQPIHIQSDRAEQRTQKGSEVTVYSGTVIMEQGSMRLEGDIITIYSKDRSVNKIISIGKPAHFQLQSDLDKSPVNAHGDKIVYNITKDVIVLLGNASVIQDASTVKGQHIEYYVGTERIKAKGTKDKSTRVHMVIEPNKRPDTIHKDDNGNAESE